ncbi:ComF family protein [Massiliimalia massiliensis]|uniref:ComF family protein n=1 Tax=Massiliimalia massiliensis TaxID=1852384 RepID=UPI00098471FC|nr:ComF family protein [Massiliimalia massiliensis]
MRNEHFPGKVKRFLIHSFFPARCPFCRCVIPYDRHYCEHCRDLAESQDSRVLTNCRENGGFFDAACSSFCYNQDTERAILDLKRQDIEPAEHFGWFQARLLEESGLADFDLVTAVPMTGKKKRGRGYNQAAVLAKSVAFYLEKTYQDLLEKIKETKPQHTLSATERKYNLKDAYKVKNPEMIKGKDILLVDDVLTTGSTVNECAKTLMRAGANRVIVSTACYAVQKKGAASGQHLEKGI